MAMFKETIPAFTRTRTKMWSQFPTGTEAMNDCAAEDQQHLTLLRFAFSVGLRETKKKARIANPEPRFESRSS
jgi:hypothetical protein